MTIIRYLKNSKLMVLLIALLLIVQAYADLSLPRYTSDLVDVGIQQGGVENASPTELRAETLEYVCMIASDEDEALIRDAYEPVGDGTYEMTEAGRAERASLDEAMSLPMVVVWYADRMASGEIDAGGEGSAAGGGAATGATAAAEDAAVDAGGAGSTAALGQAFATEGMAGLYAAYDAGAVTKADIQTAVDALLDQAGIDDSLIDQQAIAAAKAAYEAAGADMDAIQLGYLLTVGAKMLGITALMVAASVLVGLFASRTAARIAAQLRERFFAKVVSFSDAEVQSFSAASLITRGTNDIQQIQNVLVMLLRMVLYAPILAIGGIVMVSQTSLAMSWIIVLAVVVLAIVVAVLMAIALPKFKIMQKLIDRVNLVSREMLSGLQVVRAFDRQAYEEARFDEASTALYKTQLFTNRAMVFMMPAMMLIMNATSVLIVWVGGAYIDSGAIQTGDMIAFITYAMVIVMSFLIIGMIAVMLPRADVAAQRVNEVMDCESSIVDPEQSRFGEIDAQAKGLQVAFDDVTFAYSEGSDPVLKHINFTAEPGQTTAIIGATGSGKSTILKLIERFYDVTSGVVRVGGVDVRDMAQHELRGLIGYVPQKAFLFSGTIGESVAYGNDDADEEQVQRALSIAQAADFVAEKADGIDSELSQGGTNVSGGQRQRLSIARALATDAPILLFDDSFSALDYATDAKLRAALAREAGGKTLVVVAQRISTVLTADKIVVIEDGELVGCGTHAELLEGCATYREIAESQLSEEELKGGDRR